jgi:hypothetical protein
MFEPLLAFRRCMKDEKGCQGCFQGNEINQVLTCRGRRVSIIHGFLFGLCSLVCFDKCVVFWLGALEALYLRNQKFNGKERRKFKLMSTQEKENE